MLCARHDAAITKSSDRKLMRVLHYGARQLCSKRDEVRPIEKAEFIKQNLLVEKCICSSQGEGSEKQLMLDQGQCAGKPGHMLG